MQLSYAIGYPEPISVMVDTYGTGKIADEKFEKLVRKHFDFLTPKGIIQTLDLRKPVYQRLLLMVILGVVD